MTQPRRERNTRRFIRQLQNRNWISLKTLMAVCGLLLLVACDGTSDIEPGPVNSSSGDSGTMGNPIVTVPTASRVEEASVTPLADAGVSVSDIADAAFGDGNSARESGQSDVDVLQGDAAAQIDASSGNVGDAVVEQDAGEAGPSDAQLSDATGGNVEAGSSEAGDQLGAEPASCERTVVDATTPVVYVIGDSTACVYSTDLYPRTGWAQPLQDYFKPACAQVQDKAISGRSSKSFYDEGSWTPIKNALRAGDFVLIQFGHNDEKSEDPTRYTEPFGSFQEYLGRYIDDTLAVQATPVLLTPIERNKWSSGALIDTHGDYPEAMRQLAQTRDLTLVDMTRLTNEYFEGIGQSATTDLFLNLDPGEFPNYPSGNSDNTHLTEEGARIVADIALAELARQRASIAALLDYVPTP